MLQTNTDISFHWHPSARLWRKGGFVSAGPTFERPGDVATLTDENPFAALTSVYNGRKACRGFCIATEVFALDEITPASGVQPWMCTLTSGTSSAPRVVQRSQASWIASMIENRRLFGISSKDRYAVLGKLSHSLSLYASIEALTLGCGLRLFEDIRPDHHAQRLAETGSTVLYATPAQIRMLLLNPVVMPKLRLIMIGGSKLDDNTLHRLRGYAPNADIREFYGASETSFVTLTDANTPKGSVGRAYPGVNVQIRSVHGQPLGPCEHGEIWVSSPYLFLGYASGMAADTRWAGAFLSIGENGMLDENGYLYLDGRKGRMVTVADQNVFPEEIENVLLKIDGVTNAAVLPKQDSKRGNVFVAFVEAKGVWDDTILTHCRKELGPLKAPRQIIRPHRWPRLPSGKPDYQTLRHLLEQI